MGEKILSVFPKLLVDLEPELNAEGRRDFRPSLYRAVFLAAKAAFLYANWNF